MKKGLFVILSLCVNFSFAKTTNIQLIEVQSAILIANAKNIYAIAKPSDYTENINNTMIASGVVKTLLSGMPSSLTKKAVDDLIVDTEKNSIKNSNGVGFTVLRNGEIIEVILTGLKNNDCKKIKSENVTCL